MPHKGSGGRCACGSSGGEGEVAHGEGLAAFLGERWRSGDLFGEFWRRRGGVRFRQGLGLSAMVWCRLSQARFVRCGWIPTNACLTTQKAPDAAEDRLRKMKEKSTVEANNAALTP